MQSPRACAAELWDEEADPEAAPQDGRRHGGQRRELAKTEPGSQEGQVLNSVLPHTHHAILLRFLLENQRGETWGGGG